MAYRVLELTLISAKDLKKVNLVSSMEVYAVASVSCDTRTRQSTPPDRSGGRHPRWNVTLRFAVPATAAAASGAFLHILLRTERALGHRDVGEVFAPLPDLLAGAGECSRPAQYVSYQVRKVHSREPRGVLNLSYQLGPVEAPKVALPARADEPVMAYPVVPHYPPQPTYGYVQPAPPPPGYGYPPACYAAVAAPPVVQPPRKNKNNNFGLGLGAGLLGGALGGMLIGNMVSDAADYDAGFNDGGGFGF